MKYIISLFLIVFSTSSALAERYTCTQLRQAVQSLGAETIINIAKARGATREQINAAIARCKLK